MAPERWCILGPFPAFLAGWAATPAAQRPFCHKAATWQTNAVLPHVLQGGLTSHCRSIHSFTRPGPPQFAFGKTRLTHSCRSVALSCRVGTHPSGEASILSKSGQAGPKLGEWLGGHPEALGAKLASWQQQQGQGPLPFLMKVGSVPLLCVATWDWVAAVGLGAYVCVCVTDG
jgi:hypothetical protein